MSAGAVYMPTEALLTWGDLELRWRALGVNPAARRRWVRDRARRWGLRPLKGTRGEDARFRPLDVVNAEARAAGERRAA